LRILICHGYLLGGTGSNQYVQSLARALCRQGHHLVIMCQDGDPRLDFVTTFLSERADGMSPQVVWEQETEYPGSCMVFKPDIGDLLPVYVLDSYQGFEVKEFPDLDDLELERYVEANRRALSRLIDQFVPDAIQVNHAVMFPYIIRPIAQKAGTPYFVSLHGSAIEFTVKKDSRFLRYGAEGLEGASGIFAPSRHTADVAREIFGQSVDGQDSRIAIMPPGVDTELFTPTDRTVRQSVGMLLEAVEERMSGVTVGDFSGNAGVEAVPEDRNQAIEREVIRINAQHPDWLPEPDIGDRLSPVGAEGRPFVMFLGKLLETKGIQCVLPALPLVMRKHPGVCLVIVGFGELRGVLELMLEALDQGDVRKLKSFCEYGNREYTRSGPLFEPVLTFLDELAGSGMLDEYLGLCRDFNMRESVIFTGYLTPEEHHYLLPHARALLVPSLAPEAFGMVATEAMAAGVVPIATYHSGLEAALEPVRKVWGREADALLLGTHEKIVARIAAACRTVLDMPDSELKLKGEETRENVKEHLSWDAVSRRMVAIFEDASQL